jgi:hypothetical protein
MVDAEPSFISAGNAREHVEATPDLSSKFAAYSQ